MIGDFGYVFKDTNIKKFNEKYNIEAKLVPEGKHKIVFNKFESIPRSDIEL